MICKPAFGTKTASLQFMADQENKTPRTLLELMGALGMRCVHDLTNPLVVILGNVQMAETLAQQSPRLLQQLQNIRQAATDVGRLLDQVAVLTQRIQAEQADFTADWMVHFICQLRDEDWPWEFQHPGALTGMVKTQPEWLQTALRFLVSRSGAKQGRVTFKVGPVPQKHRRPDLCPGPSLARNFFQITLQWEHPWELFAENDTKKLEDIEAAAAIALLDCANVGIDYARDPLEKHRLNLFTPLWAE